MENEKIKISNNLFPREIVKQWVETYIWAIDTCRDKKLVDKFRSELKELEEYKEVREIEREIENGNI